MRLLNLSESKMVNVVKVPIVRHVTSLYVRGNHTGTIKNGNSEKVIELFLSFNPLQLSYKQMALVK